MAAAVPLALACLEAAVPLADLESEVALLEAASDVVVGDAFEDEDDASAHNVNYPSCCIERPNILPFFESSCLRRIKPSISLYDGGHGQAAVMDMRRKKVKSMWLSRNCRNMLGGELDE